MAARGVRQAGLCLVVVSLLASQKGLAAPVCDRALALRVNSKGLEFVVGLVKPLIPTKIDVPAISQVVVDWPLTESDARVEIKGLSVALTLSKLVAQIDEGNLRIQGKADVTTGFPVTVYNPYAGLGTANCNADVKLRDLGLDLALDLTTQGGQVKASVSHAKITLDNNQSVLALKDCALGTILTAVVTFVRKHFMGTIQSKVEGIVKEKIPALVESKLGETLQISKELMGFVFTARLDELYTDQTGLGLTLGSSVGLKSTAAPACLAGVNVAAPATCLAAPPQVSEKVDAMFGAGLSAALLNQGLHAAWSSGKLCISSAELKTPTLAQSLDKLAVSLGQTAGTKLGFAVKLLAPPAIKASTASGIELVLDKLLAKLTLTPPTAPAGEAVISVDLSVGVLPVIDPSGNVLSLDLRKVEIRRFELLGKNNQPSALQLDPARLQRFISTVLMPVLQDRLASTPITPSIVSVKSFLLELKSFQVGAGYLAAHLNAHSLTKTGDKVAPETVLVSAPTGDVGPEVVRLLVSGSDNLTPPAVLRFRARVDGGAWSDAAYGGRLPITTTGGAHLVEVAAVDHDDNMDPTPLRLVLKVDSVMPQLLITSRPDSLLGEDEAAVEFMGRDDRTAPDKLSYTAELYRVPDGGGEPEVVQSLTLVPGTRLARFTGLSDGVYKIRIIVQDQAGNVTSQDVGFVVAAEGGCQIGAGSTALPGGLLLLGLLALARCGGRSRRRGRR